LVARNALIARNTLSLTAAQGTARWPLGAFPASNLFPTGFALPKPSLNTVDSRLTMPYAQQASLGMEREVSSNWAAGAEFVHVHGVHLLRSMNINLSAPAILTLDNARALGVAAPNPQQIGRAYYGASPRVNPDFTNIQYVTASSTSSYNALQLTLQKRFSRGFQLRANYTLSKAIDDTSDFTQAQQPSNPFNARAERSLSLEDQRHRFTLTGVWNLPYGAKTMRWMLADWILSTNWLIRSGAPGNVTVGSDVNGDGNSNDRPFNGLYELGRNTWMGPGSAVVDARLSKRFRFRERFAVQVLGEAFNIQNRVNYSGVNRTWGTALEARPTLGRFTSAGSPRQVQLGVKFQY
jgi:hypothetical protein